MHKPMLARTLATDVVTENDAIARLALGKVVHDLETAAVYRRDPPHHLVAETQAGRCARTRRATAAAQFTPCIAHDQCRWPRTHRHLHGGAGGRVGQRV